MSSLKGSVDLAKYPMATLTDEAKLEIALRMLTLQALKSDKSWVHMGRDVGNIANEIDVYDATLRLFLATEIFPRVIECSLSYAEATVTVVTKK